MSNIFTTSLFNLSAGKAISKAATMLGNSDNIYFCVATFAAYATGSAIPIYKDDKLVGTAKCDNPMKSKDVAAQLDRSPALVSRLIKAMKAIIEAGDYTLFNTGLVKFQMDKVIAYYSNREEGGVFEGKALSDVLDMPVSAIDEVIKGDSDSDTSADNEEEPSANSDMVTFTYQGREYKIDVEVVYEALVAADIIK